MTRCLQHVLAGHELLSAALPELLHRLLQMPDDHDMATGGTASAANRLSFESPKFPDWKPAGEAKLPARLVGSLGLNEKNSPDDLNSMLKDCEGPKHTQSKLGQTMAAEPDRKSGQPARERAMVSRVDIDGWEKDRQGMRRIPKTWKAVENVRHMHLLTCSPF